MVDKITPDRRSANMAQIRSTNTKPELWVRSTLHRAGYRFRVHGRGLPGKPDIVFSAKRKVIFVHGCFWHQHESPTCRDSRRPRSNGSYWNAKLEKNVERDARNAQQLKELGWEVLTVWECELQSREAFRDKLMSFIGPQKSPLKRP